MPKQEALNWIEKAKESGAKELDLSHLELKEIPREIGDLTQLVELELSHNKISEIKGLEKLTQLTQLSLNSNQISEIKGLEKLTQLTQLSLNSNQISEIKGLEKLTQLTLLYLNDNQIIEIKGLEKLTQLTLLYLNDNQISEIKGLEKLTQLTQFSLGGNQISETKGLDQHTQLTELMLYNNQITEIKGLEKLTQLTRLSLGRNQISEIKGLETLTQLITLTLYTNKISEIPLYLLDLNQPFTLKSFTGTPGIYVKDNPLISPPPEIIEQGNEAIERYLKELEDDPVIPILEAKLLIIGAGGVGKTSMMVKLQNANAKLPEEEDTTVGITVTQKPRVYPIDGQDHILHIWDFGGQDIYHPTHQFFLTKNSIYILMQDGREQKTDFNYWLQVQELLADNSPLFIIQNIKHENRGIIPINELKGKFGNIRDYYEIDLSKVKKGYKAFETIVDYLKTTLKNLPHIGELWPAKRFTIRDAILALKKRNYISFTEYCNLCDLHAYTDPQAQKELLQQLHNLGTVLHFADTPLLEDIVITNPQWATDAVYAILDHTKRHHDKKGYFKWKDLKEVWYEDKYQGVFQEILTLMRKFELSFELPDEEFTYIAPLLLPDDKPDYKWESKGSLQMHYNYDFMPKGILARLIVRLHPYIKERLFWKRGVYLELGDTLAQITEDYNGRNISIEVRGEKAKELIFLITTTVDDINDNYHFSDRIKATKLVPCNCHRCASSDMPYFYNYAILEMRIKELQKETIECQLSGRDLIVRALIENITPENPIQAISKKIFISYSHKDMSYRDEFVTRLRPLLRKNQIESIWYDHKIKAGEKWDNSIEHNLKTADIIVLLISDDFWASDYIDEKELPIVKERYEGEECMVMPIIVRVNAHWDDSAWQSIQAVPTNSDTGILMPVSKWPDRDEAWKVVVQEIKKLL